MEAIAKTCLFTERLLLRVMNPEVYRHVFTTYSGEEIKSFFGLDSDEALAREQDRFAQGIATWNKSFLYFQLIDKLSKAVIGWCGFHTWYLPHERAELGYGLFRDADKGQGLMKEALEVVIAYGFDQMRLNRIEAFVEPGNMPSLKLLYGYGFREEGRLRQHYCREGKYEDSFLYALLREEYVPGRYLSGPSE